MEIKFYREQQHNYLIMKNDDNKDMDYQKKMLSIHELKCILPFSQRIVDGESYSYYDVSSKLSLKQLYGNRTLKMEDISQLIGSIKLACEQIGEYLLDEERLILDPNLIFYSFGSFQYSLLYDMSGDASLDESKIMPLLDYLLEHVEPDDKKATDYVYQVYDKAEKGMYSIWDTINLFPQEDYLVNEKINASYNMNDDIDVNDTDVSMYDVYAEVNNNETPCSSKKNILDGCIGSAILMAVGIIGVIGCIFVYLYMNLTQDELYILGGMLGLSTMSIGIGIYLYIRKNMRKKKDMEYEQNLKEYVHDEFHALNYTNICNVSMNDFVDKRSEKKNTITEQANDKDNGQTVFFSPDIHDGKYKLYATDRKNKNHIELNKLPCTIGKMPGYVDCFLDDPSVSRLHARIDEQNGELILTDLNSTNGVFLNGLRLTPNAAMTIELGDEIRIGNLNYCLRNCG